MSAHPSLVHVVAFGKNQAIGRNGVLPWHLSADLKYFKSLTMGGCMIMGRKTYESIGRPLPGRLTIVLTRSAKAKSTESNLAFASNIDAALAIVKDQTNFRKDEIYVVGGAQIYQATLALVDKIYLTEIDIDVNDADAWYPKLDKSKFQIAEQGGGEEKGIKYKMSLWNRSSADSPKTPIH